MNCPICATPNADNALFCAQCAEPLTAVAIAIQRKKELREKKTREYELTEEVANRLLKWSKLLGAVLAVLALTLSALIGKAYLDLQKDIETGRSEINTAVKDGHEQISTAINSGKSEIQKAEKDLPVIGTEITQLKSDIGKYKAVNQQIDKLQSDFSRIENNVVDLGHKTLKVDQLEVRGEGPTVIGLGATGCPASKAKGSPLSICADGSPLALRSMNEDGKARPVASFSNIGFQDVSTAPKPACNEGLRGTIYIQKGQSRQSDRPFVCIKDDFDRYGWLQISTAN